MSSTSKQVPISSAIDATCHALEDMGNHISNSNSTINFSTLARFGNTQLVEDFLSEQVSFTSSKNTKDGLNSQLYIACFWGYRDMVKKMLDSGAYINSTNPRTLWTPLHAATFQENGPIVMTLLSLDANPMALDFKGRTPVDFASASDKIWPHFASIGYKRTPKTQLVDLEVLDKERLQVVRSAVGDRSEMLSHQHFSITGSNGCFSQNHHVYPDGNSEDSSKMSTTSAGPRRGPIHGDILAQERPNETNSRATSAFVQPKFSHWQ